MAIDAHKLIDLAARGIPQTAIAKALGIGDSAVCQLLAREDIAGKVKEKEAELGSREWETVTGLERVGRSLLEKIEMLVEDTESLGEATKAYETISRLENAKRGGEGLGSEDSGKVRKITLAMPTFIQNVINVNVSGKNEIIDINDRAMATMPTLDVHKMIKAAGASAKAAARGKDEHAQDKADSSQDPSAGFEF